MITKDNVVVRSGGNKVTCRTAENHIVASRIGDGIDIATSNNNCSVFSRSTGHHGTAAQIDRSVITQHRVIAKTRGYSVETETTDNKIIAIGGGNVVVATDCKVDAFNAGQ